MTSEPNDGSTLPDPRRASRAAEPPLPAEDPGAAAQRRERLEALHGAGELKAALLALLLTPGSARELGVWRDETSDFAQADKVRAGLAELPRAERLPWFERFAGRASAWPVAERQQLLQAARRMMAADGRTDAADRLRWLALRHMLSGSGGTPLAAAGESELEALDDYVVQSIGRWSSFLSRMVPTPELDLDVSPEIAEPGALWWRAVMAPWAQAGARRKTPDAGELVAALQGVQMVPWTLRPAIVRRWLEAALVLSPPDEFHPAAADALRMAALLLDTPLPPALARCFVETDGEPAGPSPAR